MKVVPKLSSEQLRILDRLTRSDTARSRPRKASSSERATQASPPKIAEKKPFAIADRVELLRDVADTAYRAGQKGVIRALHGIPAKIAEVEVDDTYYSDLVPLPNLRPIG